MRHKQRVPKRLNAKDRDVLLFALFCRGGNANQNYCEIPSQASQSEWPGSREQRTAPGVDMKERGTRKSLRVVVPTGTATVEISVAVPRKARNRFTT